VEFVVIARTLVLYSVGWLAFAPTGLAQSQETDPIRLTEQLASTSFRIRERAALQLHSLGAAAIPALESGLQSADIELRTRCLRILRLARRSAIDIELDAFVAGGDISASPTFDSWPTFKSVAGESRDARGLFAASYRTDPELLKLVKSNAGQAVTQVVARCTKIMSHNDGTEAAEPMTTLGQIGAIVFASAAAPAAVDMNTLNHLQNVLSRQEVQNLVKGHPVFSRMIERILDSQPNDQRTFHQRLHLARTLNLEEILQKKIRPEIRSQVEKAAKSADINQLQNVTHLAQQVGLDEEIEKLLKPALYQAAENACKRLDQPDQFYMVFNLLQTLQMSEAMHRVMRPAFLKLLDNDKIVEGNNGRVYQMIAMAASLHLQSEARSKLQPAMRKRMLALVRNPNENEVSRLFYEAQYLGMQDSIESLLKPAAHAMILAALEKSVEVHTLQRMVGVTQMLGMMDTTEKTLKPLVRIQIKEVAGRLTGNDLWQLNQYFHLAQSMGLNESIEKDIRPRIVGLIKQSEVKGLDQQMFDPAFNLATMMKLPEAVPLAIQAAGDKNMNSARRARAIQYVGQVGARVEIKKLATLLNDRTAVGTAGWNQIRIHTEIRDVALASMIHLSGQTMIDYGFDFSTHTRADFTAMGYTHMGFSTEQRRADALTRWEQWQQKNKDS